MAHTLQPSTRLQSLQIESRRDEVTRTVRVAAARTPKYSARWMMRRSDISCLWSVGRTVSPSEKVRDTESV
jgi:hypothetical protein